jgi:hypothetical protein
LLFIPVIARSTCCEQSSLPAMKRIASLRSQ